MKLLPVIGVIVILAVAVYLLMPGGHAFIPPIGDDTPEIPSDLPVGMRYTDGNGVWQSLAAMHGLAIINTGQGDVVCKSIQNDGKCAVGWQVKIKNTGTTTLKLRITDVQLQYREDAQWWRNTNISKTQLCPGGDDETCNYRSDCQGEWEDLDETCYFTLNPSEEKILNTNTVIIEDTMGLGADLQQHQFLIEINGYDQIESFNEKENGVYEFGARHDTEGDVDVYLEEG